MSTRIEWCDETLNPFWGCTHGCSYCQARRIAHMRAERIGRLRGYPPEVIGKMKRFEPVWLPDVERILAQVEHWKKPRTIFIGFMGDWLCAGFRGEGINLILNFCRRFSHHRFLLLSKATEEVWWKKIPDNVWIGGTVTSSQDKHNGFNAGGELSLSRNAFISFEPLIDDVQDCQARRISFHKSVKWIIIGALTDRRGQPVPPEKGGTQLEWVYPIIEVADKHNIPIFLKNNLLKLYPQLPKRQEFPWGEELAQ